MAINNTYGQNSRGFDILADYPLKGSKPFTPSYLQIKGVFVVKLSVREKESIQEAVRRFRKLVERSGIKKEMRRREYYEKPSETRRRARLRAERRTLRPVMKP
jgi:small subunit ribosomal protein S21